jgi:hypothetical protein
VGNGLPVDRPPTSPDTADSQATRRATAALVFAQALPGGVEPGTDDSRSYAQWLCQRPGADSDAEA